MADSTNIVVLSGVVGGDAEVRAAGSSYVMQFSLGVSKSRRGDDGQWTSTIQWVKVNQWFTDVDAAHKAKDRIRRGALVLVTGRLEEPEAWAGKDGKPHAGLRVTIREFASVLRPPKDADGGRKDVDGEEIPY